MMEKEIQNFIHRNFLAHCDLSNQLALSNTQFPK